MMIDLFNRILNDPASLTATIWAMGFITGMIWMVLLRWYKEAWRRQVRWRDPVNPCDERED